MEEKQRALVEHYLQTSGVTTQLEHQRNRIFLLLVAVLIASTYLAFDKDAAQDILEVVVRQLPVQTDEVRSAARRLNFYQALSVISILACLYLIVNLHHRYATLKRNYRYLAALEGEIRDEFGMDPGKIAFTREGDFYLKYRPAFFTVARITYSTVLIVLVSLFLGIRLISDWPAEWPTNVPLDISGLRPYGQFLYNKYLFVLDLIIGLAIVTALFAYVFSTFARWPTK